MVAATQTRPRAAAPARRTQRWLVRLGWGALIVLLVILLLPYFLVPLYRVINPVSMPMLWHWAKGARVERTFVPIDRMAPALPATVIASEDGRYCFHRGVDWEELRERLEDLDDVSEARGVSTITQQTAKNLFLWPSRSLVRKALEFPLALWLDAVLPAVPCVAHPSADNRLKIEGQALLRAPRDIVQVKTNRPEKLPGAPRVLRLGLG